MTPVFGLAARPLTAKSATPMAVTAVNVVVLLAGVGSLAGVVRLVFAVIDSTVPCETDTGTLSVSVISMRALAGSEATFDELVIAPVAPPAGVTKLLNVEPAGVD